MGISSKLTSVGAGLSMKLTAPLMLLGKQAVDVSSKFEQSMANAASVSGATGEELERMTSIARKMGETTVFSASEAADAMYYMASAGYKVEQMADSIKPVLDLAAATQSDLAFTTDTVISTLNQFGLEASEADRVTNVFASAIGNSQATLEKLSYSMRYVGPVANSLGYSLEETTAALGLLYNAGFKGQQAGTVLRGALSRLSKPTADMKKALRELGLETEDLNPQTNSLSDILRKLQKAGISTAQAVRIFGTAAGPGMMALIAEGGDSLDEMIKKISDTSATSEMAEKQLDTMQGSAKLLKSMLEEAAISIGDVLIPMLRRFVEKGLMPAVNKFNALSKAQKEFIVKIGMVVAAIGPALILLGKVVKVAGKLLKVFGMLNTKVGIVCAVIGVLATYIGHLYKTNEQFRKKIQTIWAKIKTIITNALNGIKKWWDSNGEALISKILGAIKSVLDVAVKAIGYILDFISDFIKLLKKLWNTNSAFKKSIVSIWNSIKGVILNVFNTIKTWWDKHGAAILETVKKVFFKIVEIVSKVLGQIMESLAVLFSYAEPIWNQLKELFMSLWDCLVELYELLKPVFDLIGALLMTLFSVAQGVINGILQAVGPFVQAIIDAMQFVIDIIRTVIALLQGDFEGAWEHLQNAGINFADVFKNIWQGILNFFKGFVAGFVNLFNALGIDIEGVVSNMASSVVNWFSNMWQGIKDFSGRIWDSVKSVFGKVSDYIGGIVRQGLDWGKNLISNFVEGIKSAWNWLKDGVKSIGQSIKDFLGFGSPTKKGAGRNADEWMPNLLNMMGDDLVAGKPDIQAAVGELSETLATLGVSTESGISAGNTSVGTDVLNGLLQAMTMQGRMSGNNNQPIELSIDGQVFARMVMPNMVKEFKRTGVVIVGDK